MTVTKRKQSYKFPSSSNNSDVESLHLGSTSASDTESVHNEGSRQPFVPPIFKTPTNYEELIHLKRCSGKKKVRRYQNRCLLQTLAEEDEEESLVVIMESYKSPFTKLLEDSDAMDFWNVFIDKSEDEQARVIEAFGHHKRADCAKSDTSGVQLKISPKIRRTIKVRKNLSLESVKKSEDDLITFFKHTPQEVYVQWPPTYFERMLLHAIAQYHGLLSLANSDDGRRRIDVYTVTSESWAPAECFLTDFIAQLRK